MTVEARTISNHPRSHHPRKLRNFLLDPRFQFKYSGMVVAVTVAVASVLGAQAYRYSTGQTQLMTLRQLDAQGVSVDARVVTDLERYAKQADRKVLFGIIGGIFLLTFALGLTGIVITHRVVGPAYRLKRMFSAVGAGQLALPSSLRRHDELQDVFDSFQEMLKNLRAAREAELNEFDQAIEHARAAGASEAALTHLSSLRERLRRGLV